MKHKNPLGEENLFNLIVKFSVPAIVGMMVNALYNFVDRIFIGNASDLGKDGLAGITISFPIMIILISIGILYGIGGATLFSLKLGEGKKEDAQNSLGNALFMLILSSIVFMILGQIYLRPLLILFGASDKVLPYSMEYMRVIFFGAFFQVISMGMNNFIRADGNPKIAMLTMLLGASTNILLDSIFIYVLEMGMSGAALATILAQGVSFIWVISYFIGKRSNIKLKLKYVKPKLKIVLSIILLGLPGFLLQLANSLLNAILNNNLYKYGGDTAVSGMGIINSLKILLLMPVIGLKQGVQPIISFNYGARKYERVKKAVKIAIIVSTSISVTGYIITRIFPEQLIELFNRDPELIDFGSSAIIAWFMFLPLIGFQIIASNFFQAIGKSKTAIFLTLTRQLILLIPAIIIFPEFWRLKGLLYATPFSDLFSALLTGLWFYFSIKKMGKISKQKMTHKLELETE